MDWTRKAYVLTGLGYGDEGKGAWTDYLARTTPVHTVVRFNGGAQAGHNVVTPEGEHHTFRQFGSASLLAGMSTHLSRFMLVNPIALLRECEELIQLRVRDPFSRLSVDGDALVTTPFHVSMNRLREMHRGLGRHGSCGMGIGETMSYWLATPGETIIVRDLEDPITLRRKLTRLQEYMVEQARALAEEDPRLEMPPAWDSEWGLIEDRMMVNQIIESYEFFPKAVKIVDADYLRRLCNLAGSMVFEGAQGVLLDEWKGFNPYTTWSTTTFENAFSLLEDASYTGEIERVGLLRAYMTRHGAGPFVTEHEGSRKDFTDPYNVVNSWQRSFRVGPFDLVAAMYAVQVSGEPDVLALSHLDQYMASGPNRLFCGAYRYLGTPEYREVDKDLADTIEGDHGERFVIRLRPSPKPFDLDYQTRMTDFLMRCEPAYEMIEGSDSTLIARIEEGLSTPIRYTAYGPSASARQTVMPRQTSRVEVRSGVDERDS